MQHDITKLCADSLRAFAERRWNIKLKSSHAHEIVAAFFGYKSRAALLADKRYPINNLNRADIIVLPPWNDAANDVFRQRRDDLGIRTFDEYDMRGIIGGIMEGILEEPSYNYSQGLGEIACAVARERLIERFKKFRIDPDSLNLNIEVTSADVTRSESSFTVSVDYISDIGAKTVRDSTIIVTFPRIAGHVGYKKPNVQETRYSGDFRHPVKQSLPQWPYPAGTLVMRRDTQEIGIVLKTKAGKLYEGGVTICTDLSLEAGLVKHEVFPLADQSAEFIPMRLFLPYGKWTCDDGTEVLYNRDYCPLWAKKPDGSVIELDPDTHVKYEQSESYFGTDGTPGWGNQKTREIGMAILKSWGVEGKRPRILNLLPQAIKSGNVEILRPKNNKKIFP